MRKPADQLASGLFGFKSIKLYSTTRHRESWPHRTGYTPAGRPRRLGIGASGRGGVAAHEAAQRIGQGLAGRADGQEQGGRAVGRVGV